MELPGASRSRRGRHVRHTPADGAIGAEPNARVVVIVPVRIGAMMAKDLIPGKIVLCTLMGRFCSDRVDG